MCSNGTLLLHGHSTGVDHPVGYFSYKSNQHQRNYFTIEKEGFPVILSIRHF